MVLTRIRTKHEIILSYDTSAMCEKFEISRTVRLNAEKLDREARFRIH